MADKTPEETEIESLRAHNAELLADLKRAKARAKDAEDATTKAISERDAATAELHQLTVERPVRAMLERVALDPDLFGMAFAREFQFSAGANGIEIHNTDGKVPTVTGDDGKPRPVAFNAADIVALCDASQSRETYARLLAGSRATGSGAIGSTGAKPAPRSEPAAHPVPVRKFGLA